MIERDEIDNKAQEFGVTVADVERDYVFGWMLAGLFSSSPYAQRLILKGGNAFRKGYFAATRFSADLDFTAPDVVDPHDLLSALNEVCRFVEARTGVRFDRDRNRLRDEQQVNSRQTVYKYQLYFTDFYGNKGHVPISFRMDVTEFGRLYLPIQTRRLIHPYSDLPDCATDIRVVALEEALADKFKCLLQRRSSFDLFDLVYSIFVNQDIAVNRAAVVSTFLKKTIFEASPVAALNLLLSVPFEVMRQYWNTKIVCPVGSLLDFSTAVDRFKGGLRSMFSTFTYGAGSQVAFFPAEQRNPIMRAGQEQTLLKLTYDGITRMVEPYALSFKRRQDGVGQEYLYAYDTTGGRSGPGMKSLFNWKITHIESTDIPFHPRYEIQLSKAGELTSRVAFGSPFRTTTQARRRAQPAKPARYQVQCHYCLRAFPRSTPSTRLRPHHDAYGNPCHGRAGRRV